MKTTPTAGKAETGQVVCVCVLLVLAVWAVFGQTVGFGFINYDDGVYVYQNPVVRAGLTWRGVLWALSYGEIGHWHPLTWLTHEADCQAFGIWAGGPHLVNVALHTATTVLLFLLLRAMTGALWRSAFVAAVFATHPLRAESVAWISERKDVLSGMFFMLTLSAYVRYAEQCKMQNVHHVERGKKCKIYYAMTLVFFALGLLSKNMLVTLPFVLLLLDWWPLGRMGEMQNEEGRMKKAEVRGQRGEGGEQRTPGVPFWGLVKEKIPFFLLSVGSCVATALVPEKNIGLVPFFERVDNALVSYVVYLKQTAFPQGLAIPYLFPPLPLPRWKACMALIVLAGMTVVVIGCRKKRPYLMLGWLWYLGMLVPAIGLAQVSYYAHADRYTYLPGIGLAIAGTWAAADWSAKLRNRQAVMGCLILAVIGVLTVSGYTQTSYWRDSTALWTHVLDCTSYNAVAFCNMGAALAATGANEKAIAHYRKALEIKPDYADARSNLGISLFEIGKKEEAIAQYRRALEINPDHAVARSHLGVALFDKGEKEEAIAQYRKALEIKPDDAETLSILGIALFDKGEKEEAIAQYRRATEVNPYYVKAYYNLGDALATEGKLDEAIAQFRKALEIKPDYALAHYRLGTVLMGKEARDEAIAQFRKALEIKPDLAEARRSVGKALLLKGDLDGAMDCFQKISTLSSDPLTRWLNLGGELLQKGELDEAVVCYRQAAKIAPRSAEACANLGLAFFERGEIKEAIESWQEALEIKPDQPSVQNNLAWLLATTPDVPFRNGAKAVALAEQAKKLTGGTNTAVLHTLAAAYAEMGRFGDATTTAQHALELAMAKRNDDLTAKLRREIKLYEAKAPLRDAPQ